MKNSLETALSRLHQLLLSEAGQPGADPNGTPTRGSMNADHITGTIRNSMYDGEPPMQDALKAFRGISNINIAGHMRAHGINLDDF
jgi:hypothetical protein